MEGVSSKGNSMIKENLGWYFLTEKCQMRAWPCQKTTKES